MARTYYKDVLQVVRLIPDLDSLRGETPAGGPSYTFGAASGHKLIADAHRRFLPIKVGTHEALRNRQTDYWRSGYRRSTDKPKPCTTTVCQ